MVIDPLLLSLKSICELFKHTNPTDTKTIEDQRERSRPVNGNRVELVLKDFELTINGCSWCHTGP